MKKVTTKDGYAWVNEFHCVQLICPICDYDMSGNINMHFRRHDIRAVMTVRENGMSYLECACGHRGVSVDTGLTCGVIWDDVWNEMYKHWADGGAEHMTMVLLSQESR